VFGAFPVDAERLTNIFDAICFLFYRVYTQSL
jgi:hypothetical protein